MRTVFSDAINVLFECLYPIFCEVCGRKIPTVGPLICPQCLRSIKRIPPPFCPSCSRHVAIEGQLCTECRNTRRTCLERVWAMAVYENTMKKILHRLKYMKRERILESIGGMIAGFIGENLSGLSIDYCVPVPIHSERMSERSFNQAETLAGIIEDLFGIMTITPLVKIKKTLPQHRLNKSERMENVKGSFSVDEPYALRERDILLVDDIFTTGATMDECAKVLKLNGAKNVYGFAISRGY